MAPTVAYRDTIALLTLGDDENRFTPDWLDQVNALLDEIEGSAQGLVTVGTGKFYSNGLDLEWLLANGDRSQWYVGRVQELFNRILTFGLPTAAAVNGHAFGAGAMLAIAHDHRVMRVDRGYYCFPEVDINIPFTPGMAALIQAKLSPRAALDAMVGGHRYGGQQATDVGLADTAVAEAAVVDEAVERLATQLGKDRGTVSAIKATMYASVTEALTISSP
ncbi:enoyl-CoA hydratase-related protein [Gordonia sp. CPCC 205333]|uniref:enoyl-CoA hydratase-related protein n=1 Tax=Gordonia sp. CPCC 205333 TaxID=3140790 RepID=UPI003AF3E30C